MGTRVGILLPVLVVSMLMAVPGAGKETKKAKEVAVTSSAFAEGKAIPSRYTCEGRNISPPLSFVTVPAGTRSLALIVDDPDAPAGTWVHWVVWNIPPDAHRVAEGGLPPGAREGVNDFRRNSYGGPCPPSGTHRYYFRVYALDTTLDLSPSSNRAALEKAINGHVLASGQLMGTYRRR